MDRSAFFEAVRHSLFNGELTQQQVAGMEAILDFWESPPVQPSGELKTFWDQRLVSWLAYVLATTKHETASSMQPIDEYGDDAYFTQMYEGRSELGNDHPGDGARFHGRGFVQITGRRNYAKMNEVVRHFYPDAPDLTEIPAAAKDSKYAAVIILYAMLTGALTGFALKDLIGDADKGQNVDFFHARKSIGGLDAAETVEAYAKKFLLALVNAGATV